MFARAFTRVGLGFTIALATTTVGVQVAKAEILAIASRTLPMPFPGMGPPPVKIPLTDNNQTTSLAFNTTRPEQLVAITFNAECQARDQGWVSVVITVDGSQTTPASGNDFALCSNNPASSFMPIGAVRQSFFVVPSPGTHKVEVNVHVVAGPTNWRLDDTSLLIQG